MQTAAAPSTLPSQGAMFDLPDDVCYLNCAYMSPQLRSVTAAGHRAIDGKARPWRITATDFFDGLEEARTRFAALTGADADGVAIVPSASYGIGIAAANVDLRSGDQIVVLEEQFPSNVYAWRDLADRAGGEVVTVPHPPSGDWTPAVVGAVGERTAVVAVPNCHWTDGSLIDLVAVGEAARAAGASLIVDASQSLGALPFDLDAIRPDYLVSVGYKWLLGPFSLGYLWMAPEHRAGKPLEHAWAARKGSEDFAGLVDYADDFRAGARRYDMGEASNFVLLPMALAALTQIAQWRIERIATALRLLTDQIAAEAAQLGLDTPGPDLRAGHMLGLGLPSGTAPDLPERLARAGVYVSVRGRSIRVSPHLYNDADDVRRLRDVLAGAL